MLEGSENWELVQEESSFWRENYISETISRSTSKDTMSLSPFFCCSFGVSVLLDLPWTFDTGHHSHSLHVPLTAPSRTMCFRPVPTDDPRDDDAWLLVNCNNSDSASASCTAASRSNSRRHPVCFLLFSWRFQRWSDRAIYGPSDSAMR